MKKIIVLFVTAMILTTAAFSQTVKWAVTPQYDKIDRYSEDLFKCKNGSNFQIVDLTGTPLLADGVVADSITDFDGGYALVLQGTRIVGFFSEAKPHTYKALTGEYYATKYSFFSQGKLVVANKLGDQGRQGYLNEDGSVHIECKYLEAKPYRQGWAAVKKEGKDRTKPCAYISLDKKEQQGHEKIGKFTYTTSFNEEGYAMVGSHGSYGILNSDFKWKEKCEKPKQKDLFVNAYDGSYKTADAVGIERPLNVLPDEDQNVNLFSREGRWGYQTEKKMVVPVQFISAKPFAAGYAVVADENGKYGVIHLLQGEVKSLLSPDEIRVYSGKQCKEITCEVQAPDAIGTSHLRLKIDNGDGMFHEAELQQGKYSFKPYLNGKSRQVTVRTEVYSDDGLLLLKDDDEVTLTYINVSVSSPQSMTYADEYDQQSVWFTVTNNSKVSVKVNWTLNVSGRGNFSGTETIAAGTEKKISKKVKVEKEVENVQATATVKVDGYSCGNSSSTVTLRKN